MIVKLLIEHHLEFLSLKTSCTGSSLSTLVKKSNCWKSHAAAKFISVPGYISRSVAGSYDNEGIAIFALMFTYYLWVSSRKV